MTLGQGKPLPLAATASGLKPGDFPVGSLESRAAARAMLVRAEDGPLGKSRVVVSVIGSPLDWENSTCRRYWAAGQLIELVELDGFDGDVSDDEIEAFVRRSPTQRE